MTIADEQETEKHQSELEPARKKKAVSGRKWMPPLVPDRFTSDVLTETNQGVSEWNTLGDADVDQFGASLRSVFNRFPSSQTLNESQTEDDLVWPILEALGWTEVQLPAERFSAWTSAASR